MDNDAAVLAGEVGAGAAFSHTDANALEVGMVAAAGTVTIPQKAGVVATVGRSITVKTVNGR
jgi:hypothetical protein